MITFITKQIELIVSKQQNKVSANLPMSAPTRNGVVMLALFPVPSCPYEFAPHEYRAPSSDKASVWAYLMNYENSTHSFQSTAYYNDWWEKLECVWRIFVIHLFIIFQNFVVTQNVRSHPQATCVIMTSCRPLTRLGFGMLTLLPRPSCPLPL